MPFANECIVSAHPPLPLHSKVPRPWALDTYSMGTGENYIVIHSRTSSTLWRLIVKECSCIACNLHSNLHVCLLYHRMVPHHYLLPLTKAAVKLLNYYSAKELMSTSQNRYCIFQKQDNCCSRKR